MMHSSQRLLRNHYDPSEMADIVWSRVLRVWSSLCHSGRTLRNRPILRDRRSLLFPDHRSKRAVGRVGLRVHRTRTLLLPVYTFGFDASADKTDQRRPWSEAKLE